MIKLFEENNGEENYRVEIKVLGKKIIDDSLSGKWKESEKSLWNDEKAWRKSWGCGERVVDKV